MSLWTTHDVEYRNQNILSETGRIRNIIWEGEQYIFP